MNNQNDESIDNYKEKLFQSFKNTGVLDQVKTQLRHKMMEKLVQSQKQQNLQIQQLDNQKQLRKRLLASLINEYMDYEQFHYSQSIYLPESGFAQKTLIRQEIQDIMNIEEINQKESLLENLIQIHLKPEKRVSKNNSSTQTEHADAVFNLEQRLNSVDNQFKEKVKEISCYTQGDMEERLQKYKRDFEIRMKAEMNTEIVRIREFEISQIRMEEQEKNRKVMQDYREDLEKNYMEKLAKLRDREKDIFEKCNQKMKEIESLNHGHRQKILKDFELIRLREEQIEKQKALNEESEKLGKAKITNLEKELKEKIKKAEDSQLIIEKKYNNDIAYSKLEAHRELEVEKLELLEKKKILDEDLYKIKQMKVFFLNQFTEQNKKLAEDNRKLTEDLHETKRKKKEFEIEINQIRENMRNVSESYRRDQEIIKNYEQKIKIKEEEINFYKNALDESKKMSEQIKMNQIDQLKNYNNDIQGYQDKIEELETKIKEYRKVQMQNQELISQKQQQQQFNQNQQLYNNNNENRNSMNNQNFIQKELEDLKNKRNKQIQMFQRENDYLDKNNSLQNYKIFDLQNNNFGQKQFFFNDKNLIEESFREEMDYLKYEQKLMQQSKEQEKSVENNQLTNSRLRVFTEVERSRNRKNTEDFVIKKTQSPTRPISDKKDLLDNLEKNKSNFYKQSEQLQQQINTDVSQEGKNDVFSNKNLLEIPDIYQKQKQKIINISLKIFMILLLKIKIRIIIVIIIMIIKIKANHQIMKKRKKMIFRQKKKKKKKNGRKKKTDEKKMIFKKLKMIFKKKN
ncbi:hypothetical protein IMG5_184820 [Ichthyophthirius multifiliis]|uniref:LisH domain-containing protein n=1 Tax=Ichthyophthirius multifiliis TaxID=5932 RepID=G0R3D8_ICHMU|nr:hypothetical protein IMG5_184820 [Ichthyophthirius multifiliis]EGR28012.1 hypothetical protein IMG5_184820 [Ichthyophthirius multifiliis]|eukprot:XP_004027357.1 hypothetical protein IMG5_184820 [Ichthyophthirius multifiliis]